jgi:dolichyl-phosphate-mannose-protein mannosyltransferase
MTSEPSHSAACPRNIPAGMIECCMITVIFLTGLGLRAAWPSRLAVEHFDEGVYASNVFFLDDVQMPQYPDQHLYAPPLLPFLIQYAMILLGPSNLVAISINVIAGSLTIPLVWWVGRRWFGPTAGLGSATLVALNDVHIFFSRTALTDVLLCAWLIAAVYFLWEGLASRSRMALFAAGISTGLAWWTKYNGWLPLAIGMAGLVPWRLFGGDFAARTMPRLAQNLRPLAISVAQWSLVAGLALLIWSPYLWSLQAKGGYSAVAANHRGYVVGLTGWWRSLTEQAGKLGELDGWPSLHAPLVAILVCLCFQRFSTRRSTWNLLNDNRLALFALPATMGLTAVAGSNLIVGLGAAAGITWLLASQLRAEEGKTTREPVRLAGWLAAVWYAGLFLTTPLYTPYPRLTLPWLAACWLGGGLLIGGFIGRKENCTPARIDASDSTDRGSVPHGPVLFPRASRRSAMVMLLLAVAFVCAGLERLVSRLDIPGWEPRTGLANATPGIVKLIQGATSLAGRSDLESFIIYTYGEPAALFQLRLAGVRIVRPVKDLGLANPEAPRPRRPTFVLFGRQARLTPGFSQQLADRRDRLHFVALVPCRPSRLVTLDESRTTDARETVLELYELK